MGGFDIHDPEFRRLVLPNAPLVKLGEGFAWLEGPAWFARAFPACPARTGCEEAPMAHPIVKAALLALGAAAVLAVRPAHAPGTQAPGTQAPETHAPGTQGSGTAGLARRAGRKGMRRGRVPRPVAGAGFGGLAVAQRLAVPSQGTRPAWKRRRRQHAPRARPAVAAMCPGR